MKYTRLNIQKYIRLNIHVRNKAKPGVSGGTGNKWTLNKCLKEALKYSKKSDWQLRYALVQRM